MDQLATGHLGSHLGVLRNAEDAGDEVDEPGGVIDDDERIEYRAAGGNRRLGSRISLFIPAVSQRADSCRLSSGRFASGSAAVSRPPHPAE